MVEHEFCTRDDMLKKIDEVQKDLDSAKELLKSEKCYRHSTMVEILCNLSMANINLTDALEKYRANLED